MMSEDELITTIDALQRDALQRWIDHGWVLPQRLGDSETYWFEPPDVARVRLICELHYDLQIEEDSMSVVLSLMDQLYTVRRSLTVLVSAVAAQPQDVRANIAAAVDRSL